MPATLRKKALIDDPEDLLIDAQLDEEELISLFNKVIIK